MHHVKNTGWRTGSRSRYRSTVIKRGARNNRFFSCFFLFSFFFTNYPTGRNQCVWSRGRGKMRSEISRLSVARILERGFEKGETNFRMGICLLRRKQAGIRRSRQQWARRVSLNIIRSSDSSGKLINLARPVARNLWFQPCNPARANSTPLRHVLTFWRSFFSFSLSLSLSFTRSLSITRRIREEIFR